MRRAPSGLQREKLEEFARALRRHVSRGRGFQCLITNDAELRRLNLEFRGKDYATDVLSFPAGKSAHRTDGEMPVPGLGDIAISGDRARAQAQELGHPVHDEICILMLHGVLHLSGMDHERDDGAMARRETAWRKKLGLPGGLIERVSA
jgi:probable rRNA maturation factor